MRVQRESLLFFNKSQKAFRNTNHAAWFVGQFFFFIPTDDSSDNNFHISLKMKRRYNRMFQQKFESVLEVHSGTWFLQYAPFASSAYQTILNDWVSIEYQDSQ